MHKPIFRRVLVAVAAACVLLFLRPLSAQADDEALWLKAGVRHKLNEQWRMAFDQHLRFSSDPWQVERVMPDISGDYDPAKWLRLSLGYRYIQMRNRFDRFVEWHRVYADVRVRAKTHKVKLSNRLRYQDQRSSDFSAQNRKWLRSELIVGYDTDQFWEPFVGGELFYAVDGKDGEGWQKYRLEAGVSFKLGDHELATEYRYQNKLLDENDPSGHIFILSYHYNL